ncbi:MAG: (4Fe-4S)-binding protein [Chloroflexota bacterium]
MKRSYKKGKLTVYWDSDKCVHAGICVGELPEVFDINRRPWINLDSADEEKIKGVIDRCPAGGIKLSNTGGEGS